MKTWNSQFGRNRVYEDLDFTLSGNENKKMKNGIFKLGWENIWSAIVYGLMLMALYIISKGTVFGLDWKILVDVGVLGSLGSLVKNLFTTVKGNFVGVVPVIPPTE